MTAHAVPPAQKSLPALPCRSAPGSGALITPKFLTSRSAGGLSSALWATAARHAHATGSTVARCTAPEVARARWWRSGPWRRWRCRSTWRWRWPAACRRPAACGPARSAASSPEFGGTAVAGDRTGGGAQRDGPGHRPGLRRDWGGGGALMIGVIQLILAFEPVWTPMHYVPEVVPPASRPGSAQASWTTRSRSFGFRLQDHRAGADDARPAWLHKASWIRWCGLAAFLSRR